MHVVVSPGDDGGAELIEVDDAGTPLSSVAVAAAELAPEVARREAAGARWVWADTAQTYPPLLAAGVRVERALDLRLSHAILRRAAATEGTAFAAAPASGWDDAAPEASSDRDALFSLGAPVSALDAVAEFAAQRAAIAQSTAPDPLRLLLAAESAGALVAVELRHTGLPWRADIHFEILERELGARPRAGERPPRLAELAERVRAALHRPELNPDSPPELLRALRAAGLVVDSTRQWELERLDHPVIPLVLEYKRLARLASANGWAWVDEWIADGRFRPVYVPGGVVTGRWASSGGGALQLPAQVRAAAVADPGWRFVVADAAQLEPRVLAGLSGDTALARAARSGDLYQGMVDAGAVPSREQAKYGVLGAMYGGTRGESGRMLPRLQRAYPRAIGLVERAARDGEAGRRVVTRLGRTSPATGSNLFDAPGENGTGKNGTEKNGTEENGTGENWTGENGTAETGADPQTRERARARAWGRFTRNFVVQGTAAEWALCWMAALRNSLWQLGAGRLEERPHLVFFLHDELVVHTPAPLADEVADLVRSTAGDAGRLLFGGFPIDFPVTVAVVESYADAK